MTLEGTVIHKSGLITGGRSTHNSNKKWDEKDIQGEDPVCHRKSLTHRHAFFTGLIRVRESLMSQLKELNKQKPRMKTDENLLAEITRLESTLRVQRDDLVCLTWFSFGEMVLIYYVDRIQATRHWYQRRDSSPRT